MIFKYIYTKTKYKQSTSVTQLGITYSTLVCGNSSVNVEQLASNKLVHQNALLVHILMHF